MSSIISFKSNPSSEIGSLPQAVTQPKADLINNANRQVKISNSEEKDIFAKNDDSDQAAKKKSKRNNALTVAILLLGGVALGYGHRKQISKGLDAAKNWITSGKSGELIQKGKGLLASLKDKIMTKPPVA